MGGYSNTEVSRMAQINNKKGGKGGKTYHWLRLNHLLCCFGLVLLGITLILFKYSYRIHQEHRQHSNSGFDKNPDDGAMTMLAGAGKTIDDGHLQGISFPMSDNDRTVVAAAAKLQQNRIEGKYGTPSKPEVDLTLESTNTATSQNHQHSVTATSSRTIWKDPSSVLPQWLKDYFAWHRQQTDQLHQLWKPLLQPMSDTESISYLWRQQHDDIHNEKRIKFLVVRCFAFDRKCGGLADRLLPLPYLLQVAHNTSRVLLIHFQKPAPLEEYLVPPREGGIDWRIPPWLVRSFNFTGDSRRYKITSNIEWHANNPNETVVQSIFQSYHYGSQNYEENRLRRMATADSTNKEEPTFRQVVRDVWRVMFTPVSPIQQLIQQELTSLGVQPGRYAAIHCRVLYAVKERDPAEVKVVTENALHCASELYHDDGPFFISSDSPESIKMALDYGQQLAKQLGSLSSEHHPIVVARPVSKAPLHFGFIPSSAGNKTDARKQDFKAVPYVASDYYDTYVDLYLMAMAECVTHGVGGYGKLASYLSFNESCSSHHFKKKMRVCAWHSTPDAEAADSVQLKRRDPLLNSLLSIPSQALD